VTAAGAAEAGAIPELKKFVENGGLCRELSGRGERGASPGPFFLGGDFTGTGFGAGPERGGRGTGWHGGDWREAAT
jgi:hypothetical protein